MASARLLEAVKVATVGSLPTADNSGNLASDGAGAGD
jgi:hypothetical protein